MIRAIHEESRFSYRSPRVTAELRLGLGLAVNRKRVERPMREHGIRGIYRRTGRKSLVNAATEEDLVKRNFTVDAADMLWLVGPWSFVVGFELPPEVSASVCPWEPGRARRARSSG